MNDSRSGPTATTSPSSTEQERSAGPAGRHASASERLLSLDALRGFDMFWIMGGESIVAAAAALTAWPWLEWLERRFHHTPWHGFEPYDLIFPLFLFIAGVAMPFSLAARRARGTGTAQLHIHVIRRGLLLVLLGIIYNGFLSQPWTEPDAFQSMRYPSVLGRIGLAYLFAGLIVLHTNLRGRLLWIAGLLLGYWAALRWIPVPGFGAGDLAPGHTLTDYIDRLLIPGRLYRGVRDPEGLLGTVPAIGTALLGVISGQLLQRRDLGGYLKTALLIAGGLFCLGAAWIWNLDFPINKNLWSSSFVLHCAGWSLLLLSGFYLVIDVCKWRRWAFFFVVIGSNSILIYMAPDFIDFPHLVDTACKGPLSLSGEFRPLLQAIAVVVAEWLMLWLCFSKRIFLKV